MKPLLVIRLFISGMLIFIVSVVVENFHSLESLEMKYFQIMPVQLWTRIPQKENPAIGILTLEIYPIDHTGYLRQSLRIVNDLKKAGVKVVLLPLPQDLLITEENQNLIASLQNTGCVVFGTRILRNELSDRMPTRWPWWVEHPTYHRTIIDWGASTVQSYPRSYLYPLIVHEFVPLGMKEVHSGQHVPDVAIEAIRRYLDLDRAAIQQRGDEVTVGPYTIPLWGDGLTYVKPSAFPTGRREVSANLSNKGDSLSYTTRRGRKEILANDSLVSLFRGTIAIIESRSLISSFRWPSYSLTYWQIIDSILGDRFMVRYGDWDEPIMALLIVLAAALVYFLRSQISVPVLTLVAVGILLLSLWLFDSRDVLFDPLYPLFSLVLAMLVFPVVRLVHEKRVLQEKLATVWQELARLQKAGNRG